MHQPKIKRTAYYNQSLTLEMFWFAELELKTKILPLFAVWSKTVYCNIRILYSENFSSSRRRRGHFFFKHLAGLRISKNLAMITNGPPSHK
jgi:hypothetical protein